MTNAKILVVDDEKPLARLICKSLSMKGCAADMAHTGADALALLENQNYHLVILDFKMPGMDGLETLKAIREKYPDTRVIFTTAFGDDDLAIRSLELGADDFIHKPCDLKNLHFRIQKTLKFRSLEAEVETLRTQVHDPRAPFIAGSPEMLEVIQRIEQVAAAAAPVLICGETGTGKELVANAIHNSENNPRRGRPFISVNSAAISENLLESELFGHARGAFTGAVSEKHGLFEVADGGTLFLDEISSAPLSLQSKLLRVLDAGEFMRVGESRVRKVDVRILAATNRNLLEEVKNSRFRADLYHRLNVLQIELPPLRLRGADVLLLTDYFVDHFNKSTGRSVKLGRQARSALAAYPWPGNVRELKHCIESLVLLNRGGRIDLHDLPERVAGAAAAALNASFTDLKNRTIEKFERNYFVSLLNNASGNVSQAARIADMNRAYLIKKLKEYDIDPSEFKR